MNQLEQRLREVLTGEGAFLKTMEPMARHTTFRIGGPALWYAAPSGEEELRKLLSLCREENLIPRILGNGSDLLVSDEGCDGLVISMTENFSYGVFEGTRLRAGAGLLLPKAASMAVFSFVLQRQWIPLSFVTGEPWIYSVISVEGVPGYAYTPEIPASIAACAMASSPKNKCFSMCICFLNIDYSHYLAAKGNEKCSI